MIRGGRRLRALVRKSLHRGPSYLVALAKVAAGRQALWWEAHFAPGFLARRMFDYGSRRIALSTGHQNYWAYFRDRTRPVFHFGPTDIGGILQRVPSEVARHVVSTADRLIDGRFAFRGLPEVAFSRIDWAARPDGSLTWNWDLNRHHFFVDLGAAAHYSGSTVYTERLLEVWLDWIRENPPRARQQWSTPFELAARLNNWLWAFFLLIYRQEVNNRHLKALLHSMCDHAVTLSLSLEYHWPNNHLLLEAKALASFAALFPEFDRGGRLLSDARQQLWGQAEQQVLSDGGHSELCSMYHRIVSGELNESCVLFERNGMAPAVPLRERIRSMTVLTKALTRPDGSVPMLGDSAADDNYIRFDGTPPGRRHLDYWVDWPTRREGGAPHPLSSASSLSVFPESGYVVVRELGQRQLHITFDAGSFSRNPAPDHAHCDGLSIDLHAYGRPLLVDPGVYFPTSDAHRWRQYFRGTAAHNTVVIDKREQSELVDYSGVGRRSTARLCHATESNGAVSVRARLAPFWAVGANRRIFHDRELWCEAAGGDLWIRDTIHGSGRHTLAWHFHLAAGLVVRTGEGATCAVSERDGEAVLELTPIADSTLTHRQARGEENPLLGWISGSSATVEPTTVIVFEAAPELPFTCCFKIHLRAPMSPRQGHRA